MTSFVTLLQQGNSWLFVPSAILLGALHGLEPGHSKAPYFSGAVIMLVGLYIGYQGLHTLGAGRL
jgi:ABC-type nickel/cobalt efflux system permease component RcnA